MAIFNNAKKQSLRDWVREDLDNSIKQGNVPLVRQTVQQKVNEVKATSNNPEAVQDAYQGHMDFSNNTGGGITAKGVSTDTVDDAVSDERGGLGTTNGTNDQLKGYYSKRDELMGKDDTTYKTPSTKAGLDAMSDKHSDSTVKNTVLSYYSKRQFETGVEDTSRLGEIPGANRIGDIVGGTATRGAGSTLGVFNALDNIVYDSASEKATPVGMTEYAWNRLQNDSDGLRKELGEEIYNAVMNTAETQNILARREQAQKNRAASDAMIEAGNARIENAKEGLGTLGQLGVDALSSGLEVASDALVAGITGGANLLPMFLRATGGGEYQARKFGEERAQQALKAGASKQEAEKYRVSDGRALAFGVASGLLESATEKMFEFGGLVRKAYGPAWAGSVDSWGKNLVEQTSRKLAKSEFGHQLAYNLGMRAIGAAGEAAEEVVSGLVEPFLQKAIYDPDAKIDPKEVAHSALVGGIVGGLMGGGTILSSNVYNNKVIVNNLVDIAKANTSEKSSVYKFADTLGKANANNQGVTNQEVADLLDLMSESAGEGATTKLYELTGIEKGSRNSDVKLNLAIANSLANVSDAVTNPTTAQESRGQLQKDVEILSNAIVSGDVGDHVKPYIANAIKRLDATTDIRSTIPVEQGGSEAASPSVGIRRGDAVSYHVSQATDAAPEGITGYDVIRKHDNGSVDYIWTDDFNGNQFPQITRQVTVNRKGKQTDTTPKTATIINDKSTLVSPEYTGFNVEEQKANENYWKEGRKRTGLSYNTVQMSNKAYFDTYMNALRAYDNQQRIKTNQEEVTPNVGTESSNPDQGGSNDIPSDQQGSGVRSETWTKDRATYLNALRDRTGGNSRIAARINEVDSVLTDLESSGTKAVDASKYAKGVGGVKGYGVYPVTGKNAKRFASLTKELKAKGIKNVKYFAGPLFVDHNGQMIEVNGVFEGDTVYVRVDNENFDPRQIANHETFHWIIAQRGDAFRAYVKDQIENSPNGREILAELTQRYKALYDDPSMTDADIQEEIFCDAYGGMDVLFGQNATMLSDIVRKAEAEFTQQSVETSEQTEADTPSPVETTEVPPTEVAAENAPEITSEDVNSEESTPETTGENVETTEPESTEPIRVKRSRDAEWETVSREDAIAYGKELYGNLGNVKDPGKRLQMVNNTIQGYALTAEDVGGIESVEQETKSGKNRQSEVDNATNDAINKALANEGNQEIWDEPGAKLIFTGKEKVPDAYQWEVVEEMSNGAFRHTFFDAENKAQAYAKGRNDKSGVDAAIVVDLTKEGALEAAAEKSSEENMGLYESKAPKYSRKNNKENEWKEFKEDKYFAQRVDRIENESPTGYITVGKLKSGNPLVMVGVPSGNVYFDNSKILQELNKPKDGIPKEYIKKIPQILNNPIVITEADGLTNTVNVFGEVWRNNVPIMVGVVINNSRRGNTITKIRTIHSRGDAKKFINDKLTLYLNENKNKTRNWFQASRIEMPLGGTTFGFVRSMSHTDSSVMPDSGTDATSKSNVSNKNETVKFSRSFDSNGRNLTEDQAEYFKDSKIRNSEGNLFALYHGTPNNFTVFDVSRSGENYDGWSQLGKGIYLAPDEKTAQHYADNAGRGRLTKVMPLYANLVNPFNVMNHVDFSIDDMAGKYGLNDYNVQFISKYGYRFIDFLSEHDEPIMDYLKSKGFDGIWDSYNGKNPSQVVAFEPNQVKNIDNTNPTENVDIRFSRSFDAAGRILSEEQETYFKDSRVRDDNGNLMPVYHGTDADFNIFDTSVSGGKNGTAEGFGIYLTNDEEVSKHYGGRIIEGYANITRPATSWQKTIKQPELAKLIQKTCEMEADRMAANDGYDDRAQALRDTWISNYVYTPEYSTINGAYNAVAREILKANDNDMDIIQEVIVGQGIRDYEGAMQFYNEALTPTTGIDGFWTKWSDAKGNETADVMLAFNSNQVKNLDNLTPTTNPDIRFSRKLAEDGTQLEIADFLMQTQNMDEDVANENATQISSLGNIVVKDSTFGEKTIGKTLAVGFKEDLIKDGRTSLIGKTVESADDLATIAQVFRNPRFETFRMFFVNDNGEVVYQTGVASGLVSQTSVLGANPYSFLTKLARDAKRAGAVAYYGLHNHPSGNPEPSSEDYRAGSMLSSFFNERNIIRNGDVIINSNKYAVYDSVYGTVDIKPLNENIKDELLTPVGDTGLIRTISGPDDLANLGKAIQLSPGFSGVIYLNAKMKTTAVQEISNKFLSDEVKLSEFIEENLTKYGALNVAFVTDDRATFEAIRKIWKSGLGVDVILLEDGQLAISANTVDKQNSGMLQKHSELEVDEKSVFDNSVLRFSRNFASTEEMNRAYSDAVKSNPEEAQRMLDAYAEENGYTYKGYHGTQTGGFHAFNNLYHGIWLTDNATMAESYTSGYSDGDMVYPLYAKITNPYIIDAKGAEWSDITFSDPVVDPYNSVFDQIQGMDWQAIENGADLDWGDYSALRSVIGEDAFDAAKSEIDRLIKEGGDDNWSKADELLDYKIYSPLRKYYKSRGLDLNDRITTEEIVRYAKQNKHDGVVFHNIYDYGGSVEDGEYVPSDIYVVFGNKNVKSAELETHDNEGNLIPLSERFSKQTADIRFSRNFGTPNFTIARAENEYVKQRVADFNSSQNVKSKLKSVNPNTVTRTVVERYNSAADITKVQSAVNELKQYAMSKISTGEDVNYADARVIATTIARQIVSQNKALTETDGYKTYAKMVKFVDQMKVKIPGGVSRNIENYQWWKTQNIDNIQVDSKGMPIQGAYTRFQQAFGEELFPTGLKQYEMVQRIADVVGNYRSIYENPYNTDIDLATQYAANDIMNSVFATPDSFAFDMANLDSVYEKINKRRDALLDEVGRAYASGEDINVTETETFKKAQTVEEDTDEDVVYKKANLPEQEWKATKAKGNDAKKAMSLTDIIAKMEHDFNFNITEGHIRRAGVLGLFNRKNKGIRIKFDNDLPTATHELGHALDNRYGISDKMSDALFNELMDNHDAIAVAQIKAHKNPLTHKTEAIAEYLRVFMQNKPDALHRFPKFSEYFLNALSEDDRANVLSMADTINAYYVEAEQSAQTSIRQRAEGAPDFRTLKERVMATKELLIQKWTDSNYGIKRFDKEAGSKAYILATNAAYSDARAWQIINGDLFDSHGNHVGEGFKSALKGVDIKNDKEYMAFGEYLVCKHGPEFMESTNGNVFANPMQNNAQWMNNRAAELEKEYPEFKAAAERLYEFQNNLLRVYGVETGLVSREMYDEWTKRWQFYVPFNRVIVENSQRGFNTVSNSAKNSYANQGKIIKRAHGSTKTLIHPLENIENNIVRLVKAGLNNQVMATITAAAERGNVDANFIEKVPMPLVQNQYYADALKKRLEKQAEQDLDAGEIDETGFDAMMELIDSIDDVLVQYHEGQAHGDVVSVMKKGKTEYWKVNDPLLLESIASLKPKRIGAIAEAYGVITKMMTSNITGRNFLWAITRNAPKDIGTAVQYMHTKSPAALFGGIAKAYMNSGLDAVGAETDPYYQEYLAMGGGKTSVYSADMNLGEKVRKGITDKGLSLRSPFEMIGFISDTIELGPRYACYVAMRNQGMSPQEAFFEACDVTVNFRKGGVLGREINKYIPFFNANIQGIDKFFRWFTADYVPKDEKTKVIANRASFFIASSAIMAAITAAFNYRDDDDKKDYMQLSSFTKNNYWLIPAKHFGGKQGQFLAIPKSRELGTLSSFMERLFEMEVGENKHAFDEYATYVTENLLPAGPSELADMILDDDVDFVEAVRKFSGNFGIIGTGVYLSSNKDFLGRNIVKESLLDYEKKDQFTGSTSKLAYLIGQQFNLSPQRIDFVGEQVFSFAWKPMKALFPVDEYYRDKSLGIKNSWIKDNQYSNDIVNWLYDHKDAAMKAHNSDKTNAEKSYQYSMDTKMASFYSTFYNLQKEQDETDESRAYRQKVIDMIYDYQNGVENGMPSTQKAVHDVFLKANNTELLPSQLTSTIKDKDDRKHELNYKQFFDYQTSYNGYYYNMANEVLSVVKDQSEREAALKSIKDIAKYKAMDDALAAFGTSSGKLSKYQDADPAQVVLYDVYRDRADAAGVSVDEKTGVAKTNGSIDQTEATYALEQMDWLTPHEKAVLWQSTNSQWKTKNNPWGDYL